MANPSTAPAATAPAPADTLTVMVDGQTVTVPRTLPDPLTGRPLPTTMIQACQAANVTVPHYCYHPKLPVAGNCRMCLVEYGTPALGPDRQALHNPDGTVQIMKSPRPAIACATPISPGMEIYTQTPAVVDMRKAVLEFLLINHPLDCPICDQAGECQLQEYSMEYGQAESRFVETKVHKPKQVDLGPRIMLDDERCILCSRCIRFTRDIVKDDKLGIVNRGSYNTIATYPGTAFDNNYTLNTVDICPVGALTSKDFRFQMRVWFLKETKSLCTSCGTGCNILIGAREDRVYRYTPRRNDAVNSCWMCDAGRLNYKWIGREDRLREIRRQKAEGGSQKSVIGNQKSVAGDQESDISQQPAVVRAQSAIRNPQSAMPGWPSVIEEIAAKLKSVPRGSAAIIASARQTNEELFLLKKLATHLSALTDAIARPGEADSLLVCDDRNPNSTGARLLGICFTEMGINLPRIADGIRQGAITTLIVFGEDVTRPQAPTPFTEDIPVQDFPPELLDRLDTLIVSDILPNETTRRAHYLLPGCAHAEKRGTFTNVHGRVQKFMQAVAPPGQARPEWEFLRELVMQVTGQPMPQTIEGLFNQMAREVPAFHGLTWAGLGDSGVTILI